MASIAPTPVSDETGEGKGPALLGRGMLLLFIALIGCFTAWGVAQDLTTPMVAGFIRCRTTIGITGWSRIDSLTTASR